jgi:hypothetical protein
LTELSIGSRKDVIEPDPWRSGESADGCRVLSRYYLMMQLKFSVDQIVGAAAVDLAVAFSYKRVGRYP